MQPTSSHIAVLGPSKPNRLGCPRKTISHMVTNVQTHGHSDDPLPTMLEVTSHQQTTCNADRLIKTDEKVSVIPTYDSDHL